MTRQIKKTKVYVGLSGGVDSAVSAALLLEQGYDVTAVYIKVWQPDWIKCTWKEERRDAMRVAAHLKIPFVTLDLVNEYKKGVIDYMLLEYAAGRTPNPDVMCNREVKFGGFWKWAKAKGADFVATGHYVQTEFVNEKILMLAGIDKNKDQSYFLWTLNQDDLEHILFPIGHLTKPEVRKLAIKFGLPNALKKDSQGLCFIGKVDIKEFLQHYIGAKSNGIGMGSVLNSKGVIIGNHPGALFFTLGERHGFTITKKTTNDEPYFVVSKDMETNTISVDHRYINASDSSIKLVHVINTNWTKLPPKVGQAIMVRTRYRQPLIQAKVLAVNASKKIVEIQLMNITDPITPGQSLVVYSYDAGKDGTRECLGGGIIS